MDEAFGESGIGRAVILVPVPVGREEINIPVAVEITGRVDRTIEADRVKLRLEVRAPGSCVAEPSRAVEDVGIPIGIKIREHRLLPASPSVFALCESGVEIPRVLVPHVRSIEHRVCEEVRIPVPVEIDNPEIDKIIKRVPEPVLGEYWDDPAVVFIPREIVSREGDNVHVSVLVHICDQRRIRIRQGRDQLRLLKAQLPERGQSYTSVDEDEAVQNCHVLFSLCVG